jgi:hypothetical protein
MTIDECIELARTEMDVIFADGLRETTNAMMVHGADRDEVAAFAEEQQSQFVQWRTNELVNMRDWLMRDHDVETTLQ